LTRFFRPLVFSISLTLMMSTGSLLAGSGSGPELPKGLKGVSIGGLWYLSYQTSVTGSSDYNLFRVKRGYINIKKEITPWMSGRITPDTHQESNGDYKIRLKYAYADFKIPEMGFLTKPHVEWGLGHTPWLDFEEHINYFRLQDTMFMERNGLFNSADLGFTFFALLGGEVDEKYQEEVNKKYPGKYGSLAVGVYNGGGYHARENNNTKVPEVRFTIRPLPEVAPGLQVSYFGVFGKGNTVESPDWRVNNIYLSYDVRRFVVAGQYYTGKGTQGGEVDAQGHPKEKKGYSIFGELKVPERDISLIGRWDSFDFDTMVENDRRDRMIMGFVYHLAGHNKILVDYDRVMYENSSIGDDSRIQVTTEVHF